MATSIIIPHDLAFVDLRLARSATGDVSFSPDAIARICVASGLPRDLFFSRPEADVCAVIVSWYRAHLADGGAADPVADELIGEVRAEDELGAGLSYQPGRA